MDVHWGVVDGVELGGIWKQYRLLTRGPAQGTCSCLSVLQPLWNSDGFIHNTYIYIYQFA